MRLFARFERLANLGTVILSPHRNMSPSSCLPPAVQDCCRISVLPYLPNSLSSFLRNLITSSGMRFSASFILIELRSPIELSAHITAQPFQLAKVASGFSNQVFRLPPCGGPTSGLSKRIPPSTLSFKGYRSMSQMLLLLFHKTLVGPTLLHG